MKRNQLIVLAVAVITAFAIFNLPRTPYDEEQGGDEVVAISELDTKVDEAVAIIQSGEGSPMVAIGMLLEVLKEDPNHEKALMWLGNFSMMSGQWGKAVDRFHQLSQLHPEEELYTLNKVQAMLQVGDTSEAVTIANDYLETYPEANRINDFAKDSQN